MKRFALQVMLQIETEAFTLDDAREAVDDCLGGDICGLSVEGYEIIDYEELT